MGLVLCTGVLELSGYTCTRVARKRDPRVARVYTTVGNVYTWAGVPTCKERARVPIGRCVAYVYSITRFLRAVVFKHHACTVVHTCSNSARAVVVIVVLDF